MATYTDKAGRLRIQERNHGTKIYKDTFEYDYLGNKTEEKIARAYDEALTQSYTSKFDYDFAGRVIKQYNINEEFTTTEYDDLGRVKSVTDIKGNKAMPKYSTTIEYDELGRKIKESIPFENVDKDFSINKYYYDANGNLIKEMVTKNKPGETEAYNETSYEYNSRNFLTKVITYDEGKPENYTQFHYDKVGNKLRMYTALSQPLTINGLDNVQATGDSTYSVTKYNYDRFGRLLSKIDPLGKLESYQYDLLGNVVKKIDRNKNIIDMSYDGLNRVLVAKVTTLDGKGNTDTSYGYTLTGQRKTMVSGGVTTTNYYDDLGRLKKEQDTTGITKEYDYDSANNRKLFVLKKNGTTISNISYTYDNQSRIKDVLNKGQVIATYTYDYNGNRDTLTYSNGNSVKYGYNLVNKITQLTNKKGLTILSNYSYTYNLDGNRAGESEATKAKNKAYNYDGLGRLTAETEDSQAAVNYDYDDNNNRNKMVMPGNFADFENSFKDTVYTYNGLNQLTNITIGTVNAAYTYNGDGLRTSKTVNGVKTTHIWDGQNIAAEIDAQGKATEYIRGINLIASMQGTDIKFYLYNGHGDVVHLTDNTGNVIKNYEYDAFGNEKNIDVNDKNPFRYAGEYFDKETGLIYLRARYYDPKIGRFISEDSYWGKSNDPLSLNLYTYCVNNSIRFYDPDGHIPVETVLDAASIAWSATALWNNPSWTNLGFLAWDVAATLIPYAPGSYVGKSGQLLGRADDVVDVLKAMKKADRIKEISGGKVMMAYSKLKKVTAWTGLEAHHILEKRFLKNNAFKKLGLDSDDIISAALDKDTHKKITDLMRKKIPYDSIWKGKDEVTTSTATAQKIWEATKETYTELGIEHLLDPIKEIFIKAGAIID